MWLDFGVISDPKRSLAQRSRLCSSTNDRQTSSDERDSPTRCQYPLRRSVAAEKQKEPAGVGPSFVAKSPRRQPRSHVQSSRGRRSGETATAGAIIPHESRFEARSFRCYRWVLEVVRRRRRAELRVSSEWAGDYGYRSDRTGIRERAALQFL